MPLRELRARVEEAEKLLRVAKQLARDELSDPAQSTRARDRIGSIVSEVQGMFPGLGEPDEPAAFGLEGSGLPNDVGADVGAVADESERERHDEDDEQGEEGEEEDEEEEEEEWEVDCDKLRAALRDDALMAQIPASERPRFRAMAERLLEVEERGELYARILSGFEELAEVTRAGAEAVQRQLAVMLTFGGAATLAGIPETDRQRERQREDGFLGAMLAETPKFKA